ncbi:hypothetical protein [Streptomyces hyaluromycini]|uniref:hypothetical protein n=1 Tax=Streptomyces hyaluromycini TaxID=1377993 RepID=UPI0011AE7FD2|nr:hypothetical protein [Streptomyces hyaluromycini]
MSALEIAHAIKTLCPSGLQITEPGGSRGFGHVVVDDGHGKTLVAVNVQQWRPGDAKMLELFKDAKNLSDHTRIKVYERPSPYGGNGAKQWTVDTFREDGLRVAITALNARAYKLPAERTEPVLTSDQLEAMALAEVWQHAD